MRYISRSQFESLLLAPSYWIDVRAPIEFQAGSVPGAVNLPLLTDEERHQIGLIYKQKGQRAAIDLGHQLVSGPIRAARIRAWAEEIERQPDAIIYCFRGGLRSQIVQIWLKEAGFDQPIVEGGYKAIRRFLMEALEEHVKNLQFVVVSGPTGSGKTKYLSSSGKAFLDLEALAMHRGSAFGALGQGQPTQINFENALALELIRLSKTGEEVLVEDESRMIGSRSIPEALFRKMKLSERILLEVSLEQRIENIFKDYILDSSLGKRGDIQRFESFRRSVHAISRKLGGMRTQEILSDLDTSQKEFQASNRLESNRIWIRKLLVWYYDPLYERGLVLQKAD